MIHLSRRTAVGTLSSASKFVRRCTPVSVSGGGQSARDG